MALHWILDREKFTHKIEISGVRVYMVGRDREDREKFTHKIEMSGDRVYMVGRDRENVIKCLSLIVSRKHCIMLQRGENLTIVDVSFAITYG
jgi:hypothetical protein